jgi:UDP-2,4-diacetamido-2,4,6-trideoxy-beta-L-altropyranose hydrolase
MRCDARCCGRASVTGGGVLRVLFAVAAGPRVGFGHLIRARSLARALGVEFVVSVRGSAATGRRVVALGGRVVDACTVEALRTFGPDVLVVDDPRTAAVARWVRRARIAGVPVATVHDLGISAVASDLVIDGTVLPNRRVRGRFHTLHGPDYMILDPAIRDVRSASVRPARRRVLLAMGGGSSAAHAHRLAHAIEETATGVEVVVAAGFTAARGAVFHGLAHELAQSTLAVVAGGVTLYEACALGVPAIAVALSPRQHVTVRAIAKHGAAVDAGRLASGQLKVASGFSRKIARRVAHLLTDAPARRQMSRAGKRLVDGRGAFRVAAAVRRLARRRVADVA